MGGFVLPFAEMLGRDAAVDLRPGVTSIPADVHKLGYAPKGVSVILHATSRTAPVPDALPRRLARWVLRAAEHQGSGSQAWWAVMRHLGIDGT
jgi:glutamate/tyrosine decarboxylase-like PLP-dependent enzyme